jgi:hypothetical protein
MRITRFGLALFIILAIAMAARLGGMEQRTSSAAPTTAAVIQVDGR